MACQKVCKQGRDDIIVKVNLQSLIPASCFDWKLFCIGISYCTISNQNTMMTVEEKSPLRLVSWPSSNTVSSTLVN